MNEYLRFEDKTPKGQKTKVIGVYSAWHGDWLGTIRWYGAWRQYTLHTAAGSIWNPECMETVIVKIRTLMAERRASV